MHAVNCVTDDHTYPMAFATQSSSIPGLLVISASNIQLAESIGQGKSMQLLEFKYMHVSSTFFI